MKELIILEQKYIRNLQEIFFKINSFFVDEYLWNQKKIVNEDCDDEDIKPQTPYALTKLKEEKLVQEYFDKGLVNTRTLRLGSICGISPGMRFHAAISKFCFQASIGIPITVWKTALDQKSHI